MIFFLLNRGTKQGDPISPYLFILVIEILAEQVRNIPNINGIIIPDLMMDIETKLALFADDATFTLKDVESLKECLKVLKCFQEISSLALNYSKSEVGWIGREKIVDLLPYEIKKKVDLQKQGIKILGIYFSYNNEYLKTNNYERVFEKFKSVLSLWKSRNLTIFGKVAVVRSLAISQLLFVFGNTCCPSQYIQKIKSAITDFIWNGKRPKIKYDTLIKDYLKGGVKLPDFETMIKTNRVKWAFKIMNSRKDEYWRSIFNYYCKSEGDLSLWGENFDPTPWKKWNKPHPFYEVADAWSEVSVTTVKNRDDIMRQKIWYNTNVHISLDIQTIRKLIITSRS